MISYKDTLHKDLERNEKKNARKRIIWRTNDSCERIIARKRIMKRDVASHWMDWNDTGVPRYRNNYDIPDPQSIWFTNTTPC